EQDTVARAAILLVRFPALVDDLLSAVDPPALVPPADAGPKDPVSAWLRRDVQQVLRRADGNRVDIIRLARCYGRRYAPDPRQLTGTWSRPSPTRQAASRAAVAGRGSRRHRQTHRDSNRSARRSRAACGRRRR
ncbi:MAG: hypothetical protein ACRDRM_09995, partial [Pseudonocardiaceae bacterium]